MPKSPSEVRNEEQTSALAKKTEENVDMAIRVMTLEMEKKELELKVEELNQKLNIERFGVDRFGNNDSLFKFYTGMENVKLFLCLFEKWKPSATNMQCHYYQAIEEINPLRGRPRCMKLVDELFMLLVRLRLGLHEMDLAERFNCSVSTVSRKLITWINLLYVIFGQWNIWLSREEVNSLMPAVFKEKFSSTRVIIDCTEIRTQVPKSLVLNSQLYSSYKSCNTVKGLIGIAPSGHVTFISSLYTGGMSDVEITQSCGLFTLLEEGDSVMADKGFTIYKQLEKLSVGLNIPPFLQGGRQFSPVEVSETQQIAAVRIHVERAIERIKRYDIFNTAIPLSLLGSINQIWAVCAMLTNFQGPLIRE